MMNIKRDKGMTLIALVVTIVVIMVLAGVTINAMTGNNGIIKLAKEISENATIAEREAEEKLNTLKSEESNAIADGTINLEDNNPPTINSLDITQITATSFKVNINVTEAESGIAKIEYSIDDGTSYVTPILMKSKEYTFENLTSNTEYKVKVKVTDNSGKTTEGATTITTRQ